MQPLGVEERQKLAQQHLVQRSVVLQWPTDDCRLKVVVVSLLKYELRLEEVEAAPNDVLQEK